MTRIYFAVTLADLESLAAARTVRADLAYAATERLAAEFPDADGDELAYAALMAAGQDGTPPHIVVAADVDAAEDPDEAGVVTISQAVSLAEVASFHVGGDDATDSDLAWYATQELDDLVAALRGGADPT